MDHTTFSIPAHIHVGEQGWLFLVEGNNHVLDQYRSDARAHELQCDWRHLLSMREREFRAAGITYRHVFIPEKLSIYDQHAGDLRYDAAMSPARRLAEEDPYYVRYPGRRLNVLRYLNRRRSWRNTLIDLVGPMRSRRDERQLYYKTDSHYAFAGRMLAYDAICRSLGARAVRDFGERPARRHAGWSGDLGAMCNPKFTEDVTMPVIRRDAVRVYASPIVEHRERLDALGGLHTGGYVVYRNDRANDPRRMVLFGDSYCNLVENYMTIMLAETFAEVQFVWSASIDHGLVARVRPDIVLTEMAERFMSQVPDDAFDLEAYDRERYGAELAGGLAG